MTTTRIAVYRAEGSTSVEDVLQRSEREVAPMLSEIPGFVSYGCCRDLDVPEQFISVSQWDNEEAARQAQNKIQDWISDNMADQVTPIQVYTGEFSFLNDPARQGTTPGSGPQSL